MNAVIMALSAHFECQIVIVALKNAFLGHYCFFC